MRPQIPLAFFDAAKKKYVPPAQKKNQQQFLDVTLSLISQGDDIAGQSPDVLPLDSYMKLNLDTIELKGDDIRGENEPDGKPQVKPFYEWFQDFTKFRLVLSGVVTGSATVVNLWGIDNATQVVAAWQDIGNSQRNSNLHILGNAYFKLDDLVASEVQDVFVTFTGAEPPKTTADGEAFYIRASSLLRTSDLEKFHDQNQKDELPDGFTTIVTQYSVTGQLNRVHQYFYCVDAGYPHYGGGEPYWKTLEKDAANMLKKLESYNRSFRTSVQLLRPSAYDPWFLIRRAAGCRK